MGLLPQQRPHTEGERGLRPEDGSTLGRLKGRSSIR